MTIEFYYTSGGPFAWRCLLALEAKRLAYTPRLMNLANQDHRTPAFLALNPRGTLPVLRDGSIVVRESQAILFYLDRAYPQPELFGRSAGEAARVMQEICEQGSYLEGPLKAVLGPLMFGLEDKLAGVPAAVTALEGEFKTLDARLAREPWLAGETMTMADINLYPFLPSLERALGKPEAAGLGAKLTPVADRFPGIARWMKAVEAMPGYQRTTPVQVGGH